MPLKRVQGGRRTMQCLWESLGEYPLFRDLLFYIKSRYNKTFIKPVNLNFTPYVASMFIPRAR